MFTGIITDIGTIIAIEQRGDTHVRIACHYDMSDIAIGASIACSGVCLTVVEKGGDGANGWFAVDVSGETIFRTAAEQWQVGRRLNLERALKVGDELGGHIVTGHVDGVGKVRRTMSVGGSMILEIVIPDSLRAYIAAKGSVAVDGVSLTVNAVHDQADMSFFMLNIIPHTAEMTTIGGIAVDDEVNLEIDVLARYLARMEEVRAFDA